MTLPSITPQPGKVIFVGAGPGNPDLLTIRARQVMERNSIALVEPDVLEGVRNVLAAACAVPQEKIDAAEAQYEAMCAEAKASGARRRPPKPADPTAAEVEEVPLGTDDIVARLRSALQAAAEVIRKGDDGDGDVIRLVSGNPLTRDAVREEIAAVAASRPGVPDCAGDVAAVDGAVLCGYRAWFNVYGSRSGERAGGLGPVVAGAAAVGVAGGARAAAGDGVAVDAARVPG